MNWNDIDWVPRRVPLAIECAFASGDAALRLARRLQSLDVDARGHLHGVCGDGFLVVLGSAGLLPWCDGIRYLGRPVATYPILWPTNIVPNCSESLLARAILEHGRSSEHAAPYAIIPEQGRVVSLSEASAIEDEKLVEWVQRV